MADFSSIRFQPQRPLLREISADRLNSILAEIRRNKPLPGRGITVRQTGQGTAIDLAASMPRGTASSTETHPFKLISRQSPNNSSQYIVTVKPGTLNGVLPSNWNINETIPANTLRYCVLTASAAANRVTSCLLSFENDPPDEETTPVKWGLPSSFQVLIGLVYNSETHNTIISSVSYQAIKRITTEKEEIGVGELPYDNWYNWQLVAQ